MRQFGSSGFRLWNLGVEAKLLYTAFCLLTLAGIVSSAVFYADLVGAGTGGIKRYYAGEAAPAAPEAPAGGPAIDLPAGEAQAHAPLVVAISYRKLLEVTHFHLFTMPVVLLIVGHLFLATGAGDGLKRGFIAGGAASVALHLGTPWLVRAFPSLALLHALSGLALTFTMTVLTGAPVVSMWR
ncbi:MAG TPA: hypothetical protein VHO06_16540, partial [Polyangia bacterium]|nr:hypothetical protein [Polyangia bacterium]